MASSEFNFQLIFDYFKENGGKVKNRDAVRYFKRYLTDPATKDENRRKFKEYVNTLAHTRLEGDEKVLILKSKYLNSQELSLHSSTSSLNSNLAPNDPRNNVGLPLSPLGNNNNGNFQLYSSTSSLCTPPRQPPPYRNPPPVSSPSPSLDSVSLSSNSTQDDRPLAPPRQHRSNSRGNLLDAENLSTPTREENLEKGGLSVKERTQQFNRMASVEDDLSPRVSKSAEKDRGKNWGLDDTDESTLTPLEPKKCQEWYVTASRGDCQELLRLARDEPRLVNRKDPFTVSLQIGKGKKA
ncbi:unnamed protein product [Ceutorhynchus assimilis]|uniref:SOWAHA-C winged helix-turn-helix domain-containing protein n=1 Tax=Ceutorhynchus assimilis TaxID=467358 RepID=A0A9P0GM29_9CUCU|nr:unnamed protein product [Ceutorhynchus assimilis]